jgi:hypothetical protein
VTTTLGAEDRVVCPIDDLEFRPYYTDGECPICGWKPTDPVAEPWWQTADPVVVAFGAAVLVAVIMVIIVIAAYRS